MNKTTVVLIVRSKCGNLSESNNYRPFAFATIFSKVFESVLLLKCEENLFTRRITVLANYLYVHCNNLLNNYNIK